MPHAMQWSLKNLLYFVSPTQLLPPCMISVYRYANKPKYLFWNPIIINNQPHILLPSIKMQHLCNPPHNPFQFPYFHFNYVYFQRKWKVHAHSHRCTIFQRERLLRPLSPSYLTLHFPFPSHFIIFPVMFPPPIDMIIAPALDPIYHVILPRISIPIFSRIFPSFFTIASKYHW